VRACSRAAIESPAVRPSAVTGEALMVVRVRAAMARRASGVRVERRWGFMGCND
jgi:hypothetical protein